MSYFGLSSTSRVLSSSYVKLNQIFTIFEAYFVKCLIIIFRTVPKFWVRLLTMPKQFAVFSIMSIKITSWMPKLLENGRTNFRIFNQIQKFTSNVVNFSEFHLWKPENLLDLVKISTCFGIFRKQTCPPVMITDKDIWLILIFIFLFLFLDFCKYFESLSIELLLPSWQVVSVKTKGSLIDFLGNSIGYIVRHV